MANGDSIPVAGKDTVALQLGSDKHSIREREWLHVPDLDTRLFSVRTHRRRMPGCGFSAAHESGCTLFYPSFSIEIDDEVDCSIPCTLALTDCTPAFDDTVTTRTESLLHQVGMAFRGYPHTLEILLCAEEIHDLL